MKFNFDNKLFVALGKVVDCAILSVLWLVCCLPVITIGVSSTALYYTVHKSIRGNRGYTTKNFFHAFKDNFKPATLSWIVTLAVQIILAMDAYITWQVLQTGNNMGAFFYFFLKTPTAGPVVYMPPNASVACIVLIFDLILERIFRMYMSPEDLANEKEKDMLDKMD